MQNLINKRLDKLYNIKTYDPIYKKNTHMKSINT